MMRRPIRLAVHVAWVVMVVCTPLNSSSAQETPAWPAQWTVKSLHLDPLRNSQDEVVWRYRVQETGEDGIRVTVSDEGGRLGVSADMLFSDAYSLVQLIRQGRMGSRDYSLQRRFDPDRPVIVEDALMPCNWLNRSAPGIPMETQEYDVTESLAGGKRFVTHLRVHSESIDAAEAASRSMITAGQAASLAGERLTLIRVDKLKPGRTAQTIVTQLWAPGVFFWLYEETPNRTSYFVGD